ncbi:Cytokinin dehydrogenase 5 [Nymphaea thermarum]|nr:Cytokinin dehydrogenase 5 [Nymphaea thermarum]
MYSPTTFFTITLIVAANLIAATVGLPVSCLPSFPNELSEQITSNSTALYHASIDFGNMTQVYPAGVLRPASDDAIAKLISYYYQSSCPVRVSARGHGHSIHGQAQAANGVVVEMRSLHGSKNSSIFVACHDGSHGSDCYVDVGGGQLWIEVLLATTKLGLAPRTWTDYLYLTVGGTLSNAGVSGQAFRRGPQISNVLEMDVVTGKGEILTCSPSQNSDLFYGVLGGLGQFGIITRARITLEKAPEMVRWLRMGYTNFTEFSKDQEYLISLTREEDGGFDYVEGAIVMGANGCNGNSNGNNWRLSPFKDFPQFEATEDTIFYCLEAGKYYMNSTDQNLVDEEVQRLTSELHYIRGMLGSKDVTYIDFLDRVHQGELKLRSQGLWIVPHPWLCLFVPSSRILEFHDVVFKGILSRNTSGPLLSYPLNRNKWDQRMSAVVPTEEVFYSVCLLRSAVDDWGFYEEQNRQILRACDERKIEVKMYLPHYTEERAWKRHYGEDRWATLLERKAKYDPRGILATGQKIFPFPLPSSIFQNSTVLN